MIGKEWLDKTIPEENDYQELEAARERLTQQFIQEAREKAKNNYQPYRTAESVRRAMEEAEKQAKEQVEKQIEAAKKELQRKFLTYQHKQMQDLGLTPAHSIEEQLKNYHAAVKQNKQDIQEAQQPKKPKRVHFKEPEQEVPHDDPSSRFLDENEDAFPLPPPALTKSDEDDFEFPAPPPPTFLNSYRANRDPIPIREDVGLSEGNTLDDLKKYLSVEANRKKHGITGMKNQPTSIELTVHNPEAEKKTHTTYAHEKEKGGGIIFSIDKNTLSPKALDEAILQTCRLAVMSAKPGTTFDLAVAPPDKKESLKKAFDTAIQEAIQEGKFKEKPPIIEDTSLKGSPQTEPPSHPQRPSRG